jgi:hypothetical protein
MHMIEWLLSIDPRFVTLMQFAASTLVAVTGFIVSIVTLNFGYRNNFGWSPVILITGTSMRDENVPGGELHVTIAFQIWNRRKYPIRLGAVSVDFQHEQATFESIEPPWHYTNRGRTFVQMPGVAVEASSHEQYEFSATFKAVSGEEFRDKYTITVGYFDAKSNKHKSTRAKGEVDMRALYMPIDISGDTG